MFIEEITKQAVATTQAVYVAVKEEASTNDVALKLSSTLAVAVVISSALRTVASGLRAIAKGTPENGPTGLELISNELSRFNTSFKRYVQLLEDDVANN